MKGLSDAMLTENLVRTENVSEEPTTDNAKKDKAGFKFFNVDVIKKWLTDDKEFSDFE
jgi:hypothetical protein